MNLFLKKMRLKKKILVSRWLWETMELTSILHRKKLKNHQHNNLLRVFQSLWIQLSWKTKKMLMILVLIWKWVVMRFLLLKIRRKQLQPNKITKCRWWLNQKLTIKNLINGIKKHKKLLLKLRSNHNLNQKLMILILRLRKLRKINWIWTKNLQN